MVEKKTRLSLRQINILAREKFLKSLLRKSCDIHVIHVLRFQILIAYFAGWVISYFSDEKIKCGIIVNSNVI